MVASHLLRCKAATLQADKSRVKDYINRLDNFDGPAVGEIAVGYEMYEEAFEIYKKFGLKAQAIKVLLDHMEDLNRAFEYASKVRRLCVAPEPIRVSVCPNMRHGSKEVLERASRPLTCGNVGHNLIGRATCQVQRSVPSWCHSAFCLTRHGCCMLCHLQALLPGGCPSAMLVGLV